MDHESDISIGLSHRILATICSYAARMTAGSAEAEVPCGHPRHGQSRDQRSCRGPGRAVTGVLEHRSISSGPFFPITGHIIGAPTVSEECRQRHPGRSEFVHLNEAACRSASSPVRDIRIQPEALGTDGSWSVPSSSCMRRIRSFQRWCPGHRRGDGPALATRVR